MNNRQATFRELVDTVKKVGEQQAHVGTTILRSLWQIYKDGLYKTEMYNGTRFESFRELCEDTIAVSYDDPDYFFDFANIVERVLVYVHVRQMSGNTMKIDGKDITVDWVIEQKRWLGKLISISQNIESCRTDEEIESLFHAAVTGTREEVKEKGEGIKSSHAPMDPIPVLQRFNGDGSYSFLALNISKEQCTLLIKKLGKIIELSLD